MIPDRPGKTAIENHFDIDNEIVQHLRATGKEDLLAELEFDRFQAQYFYTRQRQLLGLGAGGGGLASRGAPAVEVERAVGDLDAAELAAWTVVASALMNLDETITRE